MKTLYALRYTLYAIGISFLLSGCVVRTYPLTKERVDQSLSGNRGYLLGKAPAGEERERPATRTTQVVEIELHSPIKFEKAPKIKTKEAHPFIKEDQAMQEGNRGYLTQSISPEVAEPAAVEKYTVQKNDTLQKISKKFYGTTKKWNKIYELNKDTLKAPDKIRPGQVLNIPTEGLKENLK